jgi:peptidase E
VEKPSVLFLPTASGDDQLYIDAFYKAYNEKTCKPSHLKLFYRDVLDLENFILGNDIIHVGGGNTANMIAVWKLHGVDLILKKAWRQGKVLCGGSAGAICWFDGGVTDSFGESRLTPLNGCLGFIKGSVCPHYDVDKLRKPAYHRFLLSGELPAGYAADDEVALHFENDALKDAVTSRPDGKAYSVSVDEDRVIEKTITPKLLQ